MTATAGARRTSESFGTFSLLPIEILRPHEEVDPSKADTVRLSLEEEAAVLEPILVSRDSWVVLNGHHRLEALRKLGARFVPAWIVDYDDEAILVDKWPKSTAKEVPSKARVVARARSGQLYPPQTSRHTLRKKLPRRRTPLAVLY